jgi:CubicO group peptidase (beta-lactamase class C family)
MSSPNKKVREKKMKRIDARWCRAFAALAVCALFSISTLAQAQPDKARVIAASERAFNKVAEAVSMPAPGCAVGVSFEGEPVFAKAFGLAEMEHKIPNTPETIFESGSVAKQFTAAALVLLQLDGKLDLDDPVRKYIAELPDYGEPLTIRHLLTHTAGLRDWGSVMALTGVGRGDRVVSQAVALDVIYRQKNLDFTPGAEYSYSNSGYQLAAEIVERVSKQKFSDFVSVRLFKPLGMTNSSWRDDYQRLVPGRAQGYSRQGPTGQWRLNMPFMNVIGNGGMLTTIGDWLKWNAMLDSRSMGADLVENLETQGVLNDGRKISYALGLDVADYKGIKEVTHSGGTAGYQTFLARFPEKKLSVGALCNGAPPFSGEIVYGIVDEIFGPFPEPAKPEAAKVSEDQLKKYVGIWRNNVTRNVNPIAFDNGVLKLGTTQLIPTADGSFFLGQRKMKFIPGRNGSPMNAEISNLDGSVTRLTQVAPWTPAPADLAPFAGEWYSDEAQATFTFAVEGDKAFYVQRPTTRVALRPLYQDHFAGPNFVLWATRDASGMITRLHIGGSRLRDMPFERRN